MKQSISILGSTGSIGLSVLSIIDKRKNLFKVELLVANKSFSKICSQIERYNPKYFLINDPSVFERVKNKYKNKKKTKFLKNFDQLKIKNKLNITISAIPGIDGLGPTIKMIYLSKKILIANKESIICGWNLIKKKCLQNKTEIIPVDSEHFSLFKLLKLHKMKEIKKIYITASGGPFLNLKKKNFKNIRPIDALNHPKWKMGKKISIDSSTLMNKLLELIEAQKLFSIPNKKIDILIHPNSLVHAIVELKNGLNKLIYHDTSMIIPLANAIFNDELCIEDFLKKKNKKKEKLTIQNLTFQKVNKNIFPIIKLKNRIDEHPSTPIIINACNEVLVDLFLRKKIPFLTISKSIISILNDRNYKKYAIRKPKNINQIQKIDDWARNTVIKNVL